MKKTQTQWQTDQNRQERAAELAESIIVHHGIVEPPIDPAVLARHEGQLRLISDDFRQVFDGMLEYHRSRRRFLLFYNTKYDGDAGQHHPRTRFSLAHELGLDFCSDLISIYPSFEGSKAIECLQKPTRWSLWRSTYDTVGCNSGPCTAL